MVAYIKSSQLEMPVLSQNGTVLSNDDAIFKEKLNIFVNAP